ncbi:DUF3703 domain-containing protein [Polaromonas sp. UC242_47]|uniref:DUF3703 domain-containing protein n=1 Tax=Polaromonas sp. UC242_47 TaxID=3374626 RepID=UPI0037BD2E81
MSTPIPTEKVERQQVYAILMQSFMHGVGQRNERRWAWLMAAHVVGQHDLRLHWRNHSAMLQFSLQTRDYAEATGQLFRLALVPLGHLAGKLPAGNIGRATVNAFKPMPVSVYLKRLIADANVKVAGSARF